VRFDTTCLASSSEIEIEMSVGVRKSVGMYIMNKEYKAMLDQEDA